MSNTSKLFQKILHENVLSGDFKIANFKANLKDFLKFVSNNFAIFNAESAQSLADKVIDTLCNSLVATQFNKLKLPKASRVYVSAVYASRVLLKAFATKDELRDHLKTRYGSDLVYAADTIKMGKSIDLIRESLLIRKIFSHEAHPCA